MCLWRRVRANYLRRLHRHVVSFVLFDVLFQFLHFFCLGRLGFRQNFNFLLKHLRREGVSMWAVRVSGLQFAVCSLRFAVCGLQFAVCSLRFAVCGLQFAVCSLRFAVCGLQFAVCSLRFAVCGLQFAVCGLRFAVCGLRFAVCGLRFAVCGLRFAVCGLRFAVCGLRFAFAVCGLQFAVCGIYLYRLILLSQQTLLRSEIQRHLLHILLKQVIQLLRHDALRRDERRRLLAQKRCVLYRAHRVVQSWRRVNCDES